MDRPAVTPAASDAIRKAMIDLLPRLRRFAHALTGTPDLADDLVQDTCERALLRLDQWMPGTRLDSWMYRIAQNIWLDRTRTRRTRGEVVDIDALQGLVGSDGRQVTEGRLTLQEVGRELQRLAPEQRVLIALVCVEGLTYREAAEVLDLPIGTVMSRLARARTALGSALGEAVVSEPSGEPAAVANSRTERRRD
ncbi:MAG: RNA polymerase sigma factor [Hyphomicrobium sp.]